MPEGLGPARSARRSRSTRTTPRTARKRAAIASSRSSRPRSSPSSPSSPYTGYASAKWSTESRLDLSRDGGTHRIQQGEPVRDHSNGDSTSFNAWFTAMSPTRRAMALAVKRFRPEYRAHSTRQRTNPATNPNHRPACLHAGVQASPTSYARTSWTPRPTRSTQPAPSPARTPTTTSASRCTSQWCCSSWRSAATSACAARATGW